MPMIRQYGERAWLLETGADDVGMVTAGLEALASSELDGVIEEIVPAAETVLVVLADPSDLGSVRARLDAPLPPATMAAESDVVEVPVRYDGPDLEGVAARLGLTVDEVVARHQASPHWVQFCGFSPGFGYLAGLDPALEVGRRASPRSRVPAGSVAIAGRHSAVYPSGSPGGWQLIGRTDLTLFDPSWFDDGRSPVVFRPGVAVRFRAVG